MITQRARRKAVVSAAAVAAAAIGVFLPTSAVGALPPSTVAATSGVTGAAHDHIGTASPAKAAQTFTPDATGNLTRLELHVHKHVVAPPGVADGDLVVGIADVHHTGKPGTVLASATVANAAIPVPASPDLVVDFASPAQVFAGRTYAIVLSTAGACCIGWYDSAAPYAGGQAYAWNGSDWADAGKDRHFVAHVRPGFVDTMFAIGLLDADANDNPYNTQLYGGSAYSGGGVPDRPGMDLGVNFFGGDLRSLDDIESDLNLQATSVWGAEDVNLGSYSAVTNRSGADVRACGSVVLDANQRVDGLVAWGPGGSLSPRSGAEFGWSLGGRGERPCVGPAEESFPAYAPAPTDYAGWTTVTLSTARRASRCINQRTAAVCGGVVPSSTPGALGFPGADQSAGLLINVADTACNNTVNIGPGNVPVAGNVHVVTSCRITTDWNTVIGQSGAGGQLVLVSKSTGLRAITLRGNFGSAGPGVSILMYTPGELVSHYNVDIQGGGGAMYGGRLRFYQNTFVRPSPSIIVDTPTGFTF